MKIRNAQRIAVLLLALSFIPQAGAQLEFTISGGDIRATPIAVVPFQSGPDVPVDVAQIIESDLSRTGLFEPLARRDMLERPNDPALVDFRNWRSLGTEQLVVGTLTNALGGYGARFALLDVFGAKTTLNEQMAPVRDPRALRYTAHTIADKIYEQLTGFRGYFNTQVAYITAAGSGKNRTYQLLVADADGYNPQPVLTSRDTIMSPAWSPDKKQLAYVSFENGRSGIYVQDRLSGNAKKVLSEKGINGAPAWSPDGRKLAVALSYERNPDIYVVDLATGQKTQITDHWGIDTEPDWSPDGSTLVFTSDRGGSAQIYKVPATGGTPVRLTFDGKQNLDAKFSPDGKSLALVNNNGGYRIALLDLATRDMRVLSNGPLDESPSFAPNGQVIIYATQGRSGAELATVSADGRIRQRLRQAGDVREPAWSPFTP